MQTRWPMMFISALLLSLGAAVGHAAGDPDAGKAQAAACGACHGQDGWQSIDPTYPNLAGQNEKYLFNQLKMIQSGQRNVLLMAGQLNGKSDQDLWDLAAYFASLPRQVNQTAADDEALALAEGIYRGGILDKGVAACTSCHMPDGSGNSQAGFPRVGGQEVAYSIAQLTAYREGERATDERFGGMMRGVAAGLTDGEIRVLAEYLRGLH